MLFGFIVVSVLPPLFALDILSEHMPGPPGEKGPPPMSFILFHQVEHNFLRFVAVFVLSLLLRVNDQWKRAQKEKISAELSYLRAQINPHFLFNTLNSIYSMAIDNSENTATAVVKLSAMMRYAITEAHKDTVPLEKEINYIADYIDLQNYRLGHTVKLSHRVSGDPVGKKIAPLILISIVENAFKYGVNPEENSSIMVDLTVHEYFLVFLVRNNKVRTNVKEDEKSGVGIENTKNQLNMIYPGKYKFEIQENPREFSVLLTLQLT
ncbi:MAG: sensor histidine kinase [Bacteroidetes bacterium]|jgi:sensor histidine kinase YesM|nr:sensor histidine kinase [Bacteroidota bacterium]